MFTLFFSVSILESVSILISVSLCPTVLEILMEFLN